MPGSGTRTFLEVDHYEASLRQAQIEIHIASSPKFKARLTWAELHDLQVLRCEEDFPRVAYVGLGLQLSFVTFPAHSGPTPVWGGTELRPGWLLRVERDSAGPGSARTIWSGSFRKAFLFAVGGKNPAPVPTRRGAPAASACASLPPRRDKAQSIGAYRSRARHRARFDPDTGCLPDCRRHAS
jgi:hypothetical protein